MCFLDPNAATHSGYYQCQAQNDFGLAKSEVILISPEAPTYPDWMSPPEITHHPDVVIQAEAHRGEFRCEAAKGVPKAKIVWTFNGEVLEEFTDKEILAIPSINSGDIGTYACNTSNSAGYDYKLVYLNILNEAPIFTERPR